MSKAKRLIEILCDEMHMTEPVIGGDEFERFRALVNIRPPKAASEEFLRLQDEYLSELLASKGIDDVSDLSPLLPDIYLRKGDILTLRCDGIVNAANSTLLGCFIPGHHCIDNAIHTFAGVQLRLECARIVERQGYVEPIGNAKMTDAYNLPCKYILHTVGPIVNATLSDIHKAQLASCYRSCLELADERGLRSLAFCCISTGEFHFPHDAAAQIAVDTVLGYKKTVSSKLKVIFDVFNDRDFDIYSELLLSCASRNM